MVISLLSQSSAAFSNSRRRYKTSGQAVSLASLIYGASNLTVGCFFPIKTFPYKASRVREMTLMVGLDAIINQH
jgi:hypothetical protein